MTAVPTVAGHKGVVPNLPPSRGTGLRCLSNERRRLSVRTARVTC